MALSLVVIFLPGGLVNFGQGGVAMAGGMTAAVLMTRTNAFPLSVAAGISAGLVFGAVLWSGVVRPLERRQADQVTVMIGTLAAAFVVQAATAFLFGSGDRRLPSPFGSAHLNPFGISVLPMDLVKICIALVLLATFFGVVRRTRWGVAFRATSSDSEAVSLTGVDARAVRRVSFVAGCGLASLAGILGTIDQSVSPFTGVNLLFLGFIAAIIGGLGSTVGTLPGGLIVGLLFSGASYLWGGDTAGIVTFALLLVVLLVRPQGVFGGVASQDLA
jgi:branched-subunit amino acid ABC-type transport system permease component